MRSITERDFSGSPAFICFKSVHYESNSVLNCVGFAFVPSSNKTVAGRVLS